MLNDLIYPFLRPALFCLDPEAAHDAMINTLAKTQHTPLQKLYAQPRVDDPITVAGLRFPNRVGLAAGLDKNARCIDGLAALGFGFIEVGTVTPLAQPGNPQPRIFRLPEREALINRLGFNNDGLQAFLNHVRQARSVGQADGVRLGLNIGKNAVTPIERAVDDYLIGLSGVYPHADYITVNISSPNTQNLRSLQADEALDALLGALSERRHELARQQQRQVPLFVKIAPDLDEGQIDLVAATMARRAQDSQDGAWGLIATNTTLSRPGTTGRLGEQGGLSGAPLYPLAREKIRIVLGAAKQMTVIGVGGIFEAEQTRELLQMGCAAVQVYTGLIYEGPGLPGRLNSRLTGNDAAASSGL